MVKTSNSDTLPHIPLSRERILQTAICLADREGIGSLSMRRLAQELDVKAMSLYNHIANKDDLLDSMVDLVVGQIAVPDRTVDWQTAMRRRAVSAHEVLLSHPWAAMELMSRMNVGPAMLRYMDATIGCLSEAGFSLKMADHVWNAIDSHIYGFTLQELNFPIRETDYSEAAARGLPLIPADKYPYINQLTHDVMEGRYDGIHDFEFGLELILNGLDRFRDHA